MGGRSQAVGPQWRHLILEGSPEGLALSEDAHRLFFPSRSSSHLGCLVSPPGGRDHIPALCSVTIKRMAIIILISSPRIHREAGTL